MPKVDMELVKLTLQRREELDARAIAQILEELDFEVRADKRESAPLREKMRFLAIIRAGSTARDLEILANSRYCEECGTIWEAATYDGCPICRELDALNEDVSTYIEDAMNAMDEAIDALKLAAKTIKKGRSDEN